jgi:hypothetical protein
VVGVGVVDAAATGVGPAVVSGDEFDAADSVEHEVELAVPWAIWMADVDQHAGLRG